MSILGLHHLTIICTDAQRTVDFYTNLLGLRLIKQTVNFDDPGSYHLYFGEASGQPDVLIAFFAWCGMRPGVAGIGGIHHYALQVGSLEALLQWKRRLTDAGVSVEGPLVRQGAALIRFHDPDSTQIEILSAATVEVPASLATDDTWPDAVPELLSSMRLSPGVHHITMIAADLQRTETFWGDLLGLQRVSLPSPHHQLEGWRAATGDQQPLITYIERDPAHTCQTRLGAGQAHHITLAVADDATQLAWRERLLQAGLRVSPVMDRRYYKSIYTHDPDGHTIEIATRSPGFTIDEIPAQLGTRLMLPPWLERHRCEIEGVLAPLHV